MEFAARPCLVLAYEQLLVVSCACGDLDIVMYASIAQDDRSVALHATQLRAHDWRACLASP